MMLPLSQPDPLPPILPSPPIGSDMGYQLMVIDRQNVRANLIREDGELYYGPEGKRQIFITTDDGKEFWLWSQRPLYAIKHGRPRLVKQRSHGDSKGWYAAKVAADDVEVALGIADLKAHPEFAYESVIHDYCARHLDEVEPGLKLYQRGNVSGLEVNADGRYIDILAIDSAKNLVVIETKRSQARRQTVDQLLGYMAWVRDHIAKPGQNVRGLIVARHITKDLRLAASLVSQVQLLECRLSIVFSQV